MDNKVQIIIDVDGKAGEATIRKIGDSLEDTGKRGAAAMGGMASAASQPGPVIHSVKDALAQVVTATDNCFGATTRYTASQYALSDAALKAKMAFFEQAKGGEEGFNKMESGATRSAFATAGATRELIVLGHEAMTGNFSRMPGSLMVLAERMSMTSALFTPLTLGIVATAGAVVGLTVAVAKGAAEQKEMNDALILTGGYAGVTSDSLDSLAHAATATGGSIGEAKKAVTELAASGKFTASQIGEITSAAIALEHGAGTAVEKTVKEFETLAVSSASSKDAVSKAIGALDDKYHFLTLAVYGQIKALEEEGRQKEAAKVATDEFAKVTETRAEEMIANLGHVATAWNGIKHAIGEAVDAVGDWGKKATPASDVKKWDAEVALLSRPESDSNFYGPKAAQEEQRLAALAGAIKELTAAQERLSKVEEDAAAASQKEQEQAAGRHAGDKIDITLTQAREKSQDALTLALKRYHDEVEAVRKANPDDPRVTAAAVVAGDKMIIASMQDKTAASKAARDADQEATAAEKERQAQAKEFWKIKADLYKEGQKQQAEADKEIEKADASLENYIIDSSGKEAAALRKVNDEYWAMIDNIMLLNDKGKLSDAEAEDRLAKVDAAYDQRLAAVEDAHTVAAEKVETVWDSALHGIESGMDEWVRTGELTANSLYNAFGSAIRGIVADWIQGMFTMSQTSAQMRSIGSTAGIYGSMSTGSNPTVGLLSTGIGLYNEWQNPGAIQGSMTGLQTGLASGLENIGLGTTGYGAGTYGVLASNTAGAGGSYGVLATDAANGGSGAAGTIGGMSSSAFSAWSAGIGSFILGKLNGQSNEKAGAGAAGAAAGAYIGTQIYPGVGTVIGAAIGGLASMFVDDSNRGVDYWHLGDANIDRTDNTWDAMKGFSKPGEPYPWRHQNRRDASKAYLDGMWAIQDAVNQETLGWKEEMSDAAWGAFSKAFAKEVVPDTDMGKTKERDAAKTIESALKKYAANLDAAVNRALTAALPVMAREMILQNDNFQYLNADLQTEITGLIKSKNFNADSLNQLNTYMTGIAGALAPITEILATDGLSEFEKSMRGINDEFAALGKQLQANGIDLAAYTDYEKAHNLKLMQAADDYFDKIEGRFTSALDKLNPSGNAAQAAQGQLAVILGQAQAGNFSGLDNLDSIATTIAGQDMGAYASKLDYQRALWGSYQTVAEIERLAKEQAPHFADGGDHAGGWRLVGEDGPEMEYTPPSHVYNRGQANNLIDIDALVTAIEHLEERLYRAIYASAKAATNAYDLLDRWEHEGMPKERAA